jgi:hypothetical protein
MQIVTSIVAEVGLQDGLAWEDIVAFCVGGAAVIGFLVLLGRHVLGPILRETREFFAWWKKFQRDWDGQDAEPGRDRVPGVMERLNRVDGELQRNGGQSVKDQVVRTREKIDDIEYRVSAIETRQCEIQKQIKDHVEQPSRIV